MALAVFGMILYGHASATAPAAPVPVSKGAVDEEEEKLVSMKSLEDVEEGQHNK